MIRLLNWNFQQFKFKKLYGKLITNNLNCFGGQADL
jgi:hypothetical protein